MSEADKGVRGRNTFDTVYMENSVLKILLTTKSLLKKFTVVVKTRSASIRADKSIQNFSIFISFN